MRKVERREILPTESYLVSRPAIRAAVMEVKRRRRVHVAGVLTFLFENATTVQYQVQEMMRAERVTREVDIVHELETYNAILGDSGELGCCLLIEIDDPFERARCLREWRGLPGHVYVRCEGDEIVRPRVDPSQNDLERISAVQYLKFRLDAWTPIAVGCDLPALTAETPLTAEQREALREDLDNTIADC
jgi:hypothetical protein